MIARAGAFAALAAACLALYWPGLTAWFAMDDFAWLGLRLELQSRGLFDVLLSPMAQGTIRPLSERLYFLGLERLFGIEALPFRIVAFGTQLLNLWMAMRLVERVTGSRAGGFCAALLWIVNSTLALAMSWTSAYNQILWPCLLLAGCHARWTWLTAGSRRARVSEWVLFLLGFGALELQVVYPAIAGALTLLYRRERWKDLPAMFAVAGAYAVWNRSLAPAEPNPVYKLFWDSSIVGTFAGYVRMSTGIWRADRLLDPAAWWLTAECVAGLGLAAALVWLAWRRERFVLFGCAWFLATLAPILPLRNHISDYYLTVPVLGLAMAAGVAAARRPAWALAPALVYCAASGYWGRRTVEYNHDRAEQGRRLFEGIREAAGLHPGKVILLTAVSSDQYWTAVNDNPFRLVDGLEVKLAPGGTENIEKHPDLGDPERFVLPGSTALAALDAGRAVVYSPAGGKLRNVTGLWRQIAAQRWGDELAQVVDAGQALSAGQLGAGWHALEDGYRWSSGRASVRVGAAGAARQLVLEAFRPPEPKRPGPVTVEVFIDKVPIVKWVSAKDNSSLMEAAPLPAGIDRSKPFSIEVVVSPTMREDGDGGRELGLAFGKIGVR